MLMCLLRLLAKLCTKMNLLKLKSRKICLFLLAQFVVSVQVFAYESVSWTDESMIHDGRLLKVERRASNSLKFELYWMLPPVFRFQPSNFDEHRIEFRHPDTNERVVWSGKRHFIPVRVDIVGSAPYLVVYGRPDTATEKLYGCPELPYIYLKYSHDEWRPIPTREAPKELLKGNLTVYDFRSNDGRSNNWERVERDVQFFERQSNGQMQAIIPRSYDEWHTKYKNSARNERIEGDCRPPPKTLPDIPLPQVVDVNLEMVNSSDYSLASADEYYQSHWKKAGQITRARCTNLFKLADKENLMAGELFVNDPTGKKRLPFTGPIPLPTGRMLEKRAERYCNDKFIWFVAELEEPGKTVFTKYNVAGDFIYSARFIKPKTAEHNLARGMVFDSIAADEGYVAFFWDQSLPTVEAVPKQYWHRMSLLRFKEPTQASQ